MVERARAGDPEAFRRLYEAHHPRVYGLALRATRDAAEAEELTQEVFVQVWRSLKRFRGESSLGTWLHRVAVNVIWSAIRRSNRRALWITSDPDADGITEAPDTHVHLGMELERALATLPRGARLILLLHDVEGYRYTEIAERLGTVKSQLHRARRLMMEALS
jgi:RNA polymerase sigma-70 factor (ECF subfamily)